MAINNDDCRHLKEINTKQRWWVARRIAHEKWTANEFSHVMYNAVFAIFKACESNDMNRIGAAEKWEETGETEWWKKTPPSKLAGRHCELKGNKCNLKFIVSSSRMACKLTAQQCDLVAFPSCVRTNRFKHWYFSAQIGSFRTFALLDAMRMFQNQMICAVDTLWKHWRMVYNCSEHTILWAIRAPWI